jgi:hypothetical protein
MNGSAPVWRELSLKAPLLTFSDRTQIAAAGLNPR